MRTTDYGLSLEDRKSTRLNSSHPSRSYAVFCVKKKRDFNCPVEVHAEQRRATFDDGTTVGLDRIRCVVQRNTEQQTHLFFLLIRQPQRSTLFPYTTRFR